MKSFLDKDFEDMAKSKIKKKLRAIKSELQECFGSQA